jgi:hypothetical protein
MYEFLNLSQEELDLAIQQNINNGIIPPENVTSFPTEEFLENVTNEELDLYIQCSLLEIETNLSPYELSITYGCPNFYSPQTAYNNYLAEKEKRENEGSEESENEQIIDESNTKRNTQILILALVGISFFVFNNKK